MLRVALRTVPRQVYPVPALRAAACPWGGAVPVAPRAPSGRATRPAAVASHIRLPRTSHPVIALPPDLRASTSAHCTLPCLPARAPTSTHTHKDASPWRLPYLQAPRRPAPVRFSCPSMQPHPPRPRRPSPCKLPSMLLQVRPHSRIPPPPQRMSNPLPLRGNPTTPVPPPDAQRDGPGLLVQAAVVQLHVGVVHVHAVDQLHDGGWAGVCGLGVNTRGTAPCWSCPCTRC